MRENGTNCLLEMCFISNPNDMLAYDSKFDEVVDFIANTIKKRL